MKNVKYIIDDIDDYLYLIENFSIQEDVYLAELLAKLRKGEVSIIYTFDKTLSVAMSYETNDIEQVSTEVSELLNSFYFDTHFFDVFKYKVPVPFGSDSFDFLLEFFEKNNFLKNNYDFDENKKTYVFFGEFDAYKGTRRIFNVSNDYYLFSRGDDFSMASMPTLKNILFVREFLGKFL